MDNKYGATAVALVLNVCEHMTFLPEEVEYIWRHPWRPRISSWMFIFTRYGTYIMHILNAIYPDVDPTLESPEYHDFLALSFRIMASSVIILVIHFVLAKRLTLFYPGIWVRLFILPGFLIAHAIYVGSLEVTATYTPVYNLHSCFHLLMSFCLFPKRGGEVLLESLMLVFMAIAHFTSIPCCRNPLIYRLKRVEGVGVPSFALIAPAMAATMPYMDHSRTTMIFSLYVSVMSALACRLILSNHRAIHEAPPAEYRLVNQRL